MSEHAGRHDVWSGTGGASGLVVGAGNPGPRPAVLLTTAIAGINDYVVRQAERLDAAGYVCLVLDYHARAGVPDLSTPEKVMSAVAGLSDVLVLRDMAEAARWLREQPFADADRIGALGFCIGGTYALLAASHVPGLRCAVSFYGMLHYNQTTQAKPQSPLECASTAACPVLGHFGEDDHIVPVAHARELAERLRGKPAEIYTYPGAGHAFHEDFRPQVYRPVAAATAWARTQEYLSFYLLNGGQS
jgi:carboxymethylenebutenolidase